jgi:hypothetical protein
MTSDTSPPPMAAQSNDLRAESGPERSLKRCLWGSWRSGASAAAALTPSLIVNSLIIIRRETVRHADIQAAGDYASAAPS